MHHEKLTVALSASAFCLLVQLSSVASGSNYHAAFSDPRRGEQAPRRRSSSYSSHRCIGSQNNHELEIGRACRFDNICLTSGKWVYYEPILTTKIYDKSKGELANFSNYGHPFLHVRALFSPPFSPDIVISKVPDNAERQSGNHFLFSPWCKPFNLGHNLWEELAYAYVTPRRFGTFDKSIQVIQMSNDFTEVPWKKMMEAYFPAISNRPIAYADDLVERSKTRPICFDQVFVGGAVRVFINHGGIHGSEIQMDGREEGFMGLRNAILDHFNISQPSLPVHPVIYIAEKTGKRRIYNIREVETFLKQRFPFAFVLAVQWDQMTIPQELEMISSGSILITPCGGISMNIPFLPDGAHAVIMDYPAATKVFGFSRGDSASMEITFWDRFPHVHKHYYQVRITDNSSYVVEGSPFNLRDTAAIIIDLVRLEKIMIQALMEMMYVDENERVIEYLPEQNGTSPMQSGTLSEHHWNLQNRTMPTLRLTVADALPELHFPGWLLDIPYVIWASVFIVVVARVLVRCCKSMTKK